MTTTKAELIDFEDYRADFLWHTMDDRDLTIDDMDTKHIFNSMKMIFNHIAQEAGLETVWFTKKYEGYEEMAAEIPEELLVQMNFFLIEIENRGDLPEKYKEPYEKIKRIITGRKIFILSKHREVEE